MQGSFSGIAAGILQLVEIKLRLQPTQRFILFAVWLLCFVSPAWGKPEAAYRWNEMPDLEQSLERQIDQTLFPDLINGALLFTEFTEDEDRRGNQTGYVSLQASQQLFATVIYYSPSGICSIDRNSVLLQPGHLVSLSVDLVENEWDGVLYTVAWLNPPSEEETVNIAVNPYGSGELMPGIAATATFLRGPGPDSNHPWDDEYRIVNWDPPDYFAVDHPAALVRVDEEGVISSKDCTVEFNGIIGFGFDEWGRLGLMELSSIDTIKVEFEIPFDLRYSRGSLFVYISSARTGRGNPPGLESVVNNWSFVNMSPGEGPAVEMQHFQYDVSHYLKGGYNLIELRLPSGSGQELEVERIELWLE